MNRVLVVIACIVAPFAAMASPSPYRPLSVTPSGEQVFGFSESPDAPRFQTIAHGGPIDPKASGVQRYYKLLPAKDESRWRRRINGALASINCGLGVPEITAHFVRGASGRIRMFSSWHGIAPSVDTRGNLAKICKVRLGPTTTSLTNCSLVNLQRGSALAPSEIGPEFIRHHDNRNFSAAFQVSQSDWASFELACDGTPAGVSQADLIENSAIPACGHGPADVAATVKGLPAARFVSVGIIASQRVYSDRGSWDENLSTRYNACLFSNYTDFGMSGGFLAARLGEGVCSVCTINTQSYRMQAADAAGTPSMDTLSERELIGNYQNSGAHYPSF